MKVALVVPSKCFSSRKDDGSQKNTAHKQCLWVRRQHNKFTQLSMKHHHRANFGEALKKMLKILVFSKESFTASKSESEVMTMQRCFIFWYVNVVMDIECNPNFITIEYCQFKVWGKWVNLQPGGDPCWSLVIAGGWGGRRVVLTTAQLQSHRYNIRMTFNLPLKRNMKRGRTESRFSMRGLYPLRVPTSFQPGGEGVLRFKKKCVQHTDMSDIGYFYTETNGK